MTRLLLLICLALLTGCALRKHLTPVFPNGHEIACSSYGYCGPNSGAYMMGSEVCYTDDLTTAQPIFNQDSKCR